MKNFLLLFTLLLTVSYQLNAQWELQNYFPTSNDLHSIFFTDSQTGWIVGNNGTILKTTNGGDSWNSQQSGTSNWLSSVYFTNNQIGWVAGTSGRILKTANGGEEWISHYIGIQAWLNSVYFVDDLVGWVVGGNGYNGKILKTINGGESWVSQNSGSGNVLRSVYFTDNKTGWIVGDAGTILHTTNGGITFIEEESNFPQPNEFLIQQNYPNPFNPSTNIQYSISTAQFVTLKVYDILGNEIATLVNDYKPAGTYEVTFDASKLSSGIYFYKLQSGNFVQTRKMILLK